jgi:hypothetical protein
LNKDNSRGQDLLRARVELARQRLIEVSLARSDFDTAPPFPWVITGIGSSESHARYLVELVNQISPGSALYWSASLFAVGVLPQDTFRSTLIIFTQGLSANAGIACTYAGSFAKTVLFTAATAEDLKQSGNTPALEKWEALQDHGVCVVKTPEPQEYTLLIRTVGPLCGYAVALKWLNAVCGWYGREIDLIASIPDAAVAVPEETIHALGRSFIGGFELNFVAGEEAYAQNLLCKRVEGIFQPQPASRGILQMAHGPFQQNFADPADQWILYANRSAEKQLVDRVRPMFELLGSSVHEIVAPHPAPLSIFYYEMLFDRVLLDAFEKVDLSQLNWPGKGLDTEGYSISEPMGGL